MKMHILSGGRLRMRKSIYWPEAERGETFEMPVISVLMRHAKGNVLFDTGCHPSVIDDAPARWGDLARLMTPLMRPGEDLVSNMACTGVAPDDVDVVVCSHLHPDHCGCNAFFRKATVMVHARELEAARTPDAAASGYLAADFEGFSAIEAVEGERDLFGDGRIVLKHLPGHTPGLMGALVSLDRDGAFLLASDAVPVRAVLDRDITPKNTWNIEQALASYAEIRRIEQAGATVICGHDDAQWQSLRTGAAHYE